MKERLPVLSINATELRRLDPDRYVSTLFAPAATRDALFALYGFDCQIARVRHLVREPMPGLIRLQWWRDGLDDISKGTTPVHPILDGLSQAVGLGLDLGRLEAAIRARERELEEPPPLSYDDFEQHLTIANGGIARAAASLLGCHDADALIAADHIGVVLGLLEHAGTLGTAGRGQPLWLPDMMVKGEAAIGCHSSPEFADDKPDGSLTCRVGPRLAAWARDHLDLARRQRRLISRQVLPAFLPGMLADVRLRHPDHPASGRRPLTSAAYRVMWCWLRRCF